MAVDYTPTLGDYKELKPFRYWCQKVLPLVYDDSLSYYELLCKVVDYLNKTMEDVETLHGDVEDLHDAYVLLQSYVNDYFDNLDVQEEINNKLDEMATDGSLASLIAQVIGSVPTPIFVNSTDDMTDTTKVYVLYPDGYIYYHNGSTWVNTEMVYGTSNMIVTPFSAQVTSSNYETLGISSVDEQPINTIVTYATSFVNLETAGTFPPNCGACTVLTYAGYPGATATTMQLCGFLYGSDVLLYVRESYGTGWYSWSKLTNELSLSSFGKAITPDNYQSLGISSVDSQPVNTVITYNSAYIALSGTGTFPDGCESTCTVITFNGQKSLAGGSIQIGTWQYGASIRFLTGNGWTRWLRITPDPHAIVCIDDVVTSSNYTTLGITSVDTQNINTVITYNSSFVALDGVGTFPPNCGTCTVLTYCGFTGATNTQMQLCGFIVGTDTLLYVREKSIYGWSAWNKLSNELSVQSLGSVVTNSNYTSLGVSTVDTQATNTVVTYNSGFVNMAGSGTFPPECTSTCTVATLNGYKSLSGGAMQICAWQMWDLNNETNYAVRFLTSSGWCNWSLIKPLTSNQLFYVRNKANFVSTCINKPITLTSGTKVFVFGDSIATNSHGGFTWCSLICTKFGCTEYNYSVSGAPFNEASEIAIINQITTAKNDLPDADIIFVAGGVNDWSNKNYTNLRTYVQNVIDAIRELNETAEIIFITPIRCTSSFDIAERIPNISSVICNTALMNECSVINGYDFPIPTDTTSIYTECTDGDHTHPNATGKWIYATSVINALL